MQIIINYIINYNKKILETDKHTYYIPSVYSHPDGFDKTKIFSEHYGPAVYNVWIPMLTKQTPSIYPYSELMNRYWVGHAVIISGGIAVGYGPYNETGGLSQDGAVKVEDAAYINDLISEGKAKIIDVKYGYDAMETRMKINKYLKENTLETISSSTGHILPMTTQSGFSNYGFGKWGGTWYDLDSLPVLTCIGFADGLFHYGNASATGIVSTPGNWLKLGFTNGEYIDYATYEEEL